MLLHVLLPGSKPVITQRLDGTNRWAFVTATRKNGRSASFHRMQSHCMLRPFCLSLVESNANAKELAHSWPNFPTLQHSYDAFTGAKLVICIPWTWIVT